MTRIQMRSRYEHHFAYGGRALLITDLHGMVDGGTCGFFYENTRLLSCFRLEANGEPLRPVIASPVAGNCLLAYYQVPPSEHVPATAVHVEAAHALGEGLRSELRLQSHAITETVRFELAIHLAADFIDLKWAQAGERPIQAGLQTSWDQDCRELTIRYQQPQLDRQVAVRVEAPGELAYRDGALRLPVRLAPREKLEIVMVTEPIFHGVRHPAPTQVFRPTATRLGGVRTQLQDDAPRLVTSNTTVARAWQTAVADLAELPLGATPGPAAVAAGIPAYVQLYGRDTLFTGFQALMAMPTLLRDALRVHAHLQGTKVDNYHDEEPGKMFAQVRDGPYSMLGLDPQHHYYGDYAAQGDFLIMVGQYLAWTGDLDTVRELLPSARKLCTWFREYGDLDGDGFLEYVTRSSRGVKNQGWKDSPTAIVYEDGRIVPNPIATCEIQAYWYAGLRQTALAFLIAGDWRYALDLWRQAEDLRRRFDRTFWMEEEGFYALALDPEKRKVRSIASNTGQLLATGIVPAEKGRRVARRMMQPDLFSGWGVRTLSSDHVAYNPFSYHLGSVWPAENGTFVFGFARYGCWQEAHRLAEGLFSLTDLFVENRLPEDVGGFPRDELHPHPGIYPAANEPQAWSDGMIVMTIQALLGMRPFAPLNLLLLDPHLPSWLPDLRVEGLRVGQALVDLEFRRRRSGTTTYRVTRREGNLLVVRQPVPQGPNASLGRRLIAALRSLPKLL